MDIEVDQFGRDIKRRGDYNGGGDNNNSNNNKSNNYNYNRNNNNGGNYKRARRYDGERTTHRGGEDNSNSSKEDKLRQRIKQLGDTESSRRTNSIEALSEVVIKEYSDNSEGTLVRDIQQAAIEFPWKSYVYSTLVGYVYGKNPTVGRELVQGIYEMLVKAVGAGRWRQVKTVMRVLAGLVSTGSVARDWYIEQLGAFLSQATKPSAHSSMFVWLVSHILLENANKLGVAAAAAAAAGEGEGANEAVGDSRIDELVQRMVEYRDALGDVNELAAAVVQAVQAMQSGWKQEWKTEVLANHGAAAVAQEYATAEQLSFEVVVPQHDQSSASKDVVQLYCPAADVTIFDIPAEHETQWTILCEVISDSLEPLSVNRKEASVYLTQVIANAVELSDTEVQPQIDRAIITALFSRLFDHTYPTTCAQPPVFVSALVVSLTKRDPDTYAQLVDAAFAATLNASTFRLLADVHCIYASNFEFKSNYDQLNDPRFIRLTLAKQLRLSYYEHIAGVLSSSSSLSQSLLPPKPVPKFKFTVDAMDAQTKAISVELGKNFKAKIAADQAASLLDSLYPDSSDSAVLANKREMLFNHLLLLGSKGICSLLNTLDKYLSLIKHIYSQSLSVDGSLDLAKQSLLACAVSFWRLHPQMLLIVLDKFVNFQLLDPAFALSAIIDLFNSLSSNQDYDSVLSVEFITQFLTLLISKISLRIDIVSSNSPDDPQLSILQNDLLAIITRSLEFYLVLFSSAQSDQSADIPAYYLPFLLDNAQIVVPSADLLKSSSFVPLQSKAADLNLDPTKLASLSESFDLVVKYFS